MFTKNPIVAKHIFNVPYNDLINKMVIKFT